SRGRHLVAAVEIVSPANKDRRENRRAFVTKCAALLQQGVCVSLVDLVTTRHFNLYCDLLVQFDGGCDGSAVNRRPPPPPPAAACLAGPRPTLRRCAPRSASARRRRWTRRGCNRCYRPRRGNGWWSRRATWPSCWWSVSSCAGCRCTGPVCAPARPGRGAAT